MATYRAGTAGTHVTHAIRVDTLPTEIAEDPRLTFTAACGVPVTPDASASFRAAPNPCQRCVARVQKVDHAERAAAREEAQP